MGIVVEEADETVFWLEIMVETELIPQAKMQDLQKKANELLAIFSASLRTARRDFQ